MEELFDLKKLCSLGCSIVADCSATLAATNEEIPSSSNAFCKSSVRRARLISTFKPKMAEKNV